MAKTQSQMGRVEPITVRELLEAKGPAWDLEVIEGKRWLEREIPTFELNRPGLALAGHFEVFSHGRVQLIGITETSFLGRLSPSERAMRIRRMLEFPIPCVIITTSQEIFPEMRREMRKRKLPLLRTSHTSSPFQAELGQFLERRLAPHWLVHGVMVEVFGLGVLIQGKSGVGKSECGLELVERGHLLVADDVVWMRRVTPGRLFASPAPNLRYHMEIRGIGIIDVERLFGARSVREETELALVVELERWDPRKEYERLGLRENYVELFNCEIPQVILPIEPGRNISQLIEIAALMRRLKAQGINVAADFDRDILQTINRKRGRRRSSRAVEPVRTGRKRRS